MPPPDVPSARAVLRGPRVVLRGPREPDRDARAALGRDPEVVRGFGGSDPDRVELRPQELERWWQRLCDASHGWVIEVDGRFAGEIRLDDVDHGEKTDQLAIGLFDAELLGRGLGSEAIQVLLAHAFGSMGLERVSLQVLESNERAIRCYRTWGFSIEGRLRASTIVDGRRQDELVMGLLRDEFLGRFLPGETRDQRGADDTDAQRRAWIETLPRKRMASAALIRDEASRILIVEPTYRPYWMAPGGVIEEDEGPRDGCEREVHEELGIDLKLGDVLCVHYQPPRTDATESVMFVFDGGVHSTSWFDRISLQEAELRSWTLAEPDELDDRLPRRLARRLQHACRALQGDPVYLADNDDQSSFG